MSILVATDLSSPARQAADRAARLARATGAPLQLVHALSAGMAAQLQQLLGMGSALESTLIEQTRVELRALAADIAAERQVSVEPTLLHVNVVTEITREAEAMQADLVVLGLAADGNSLTGTNTAQIINTAGVVLQQACISETGVRTLW